MRHDLRPAERKLWYFLRDRRLNGLKFRRQHPIGPFIADFYCPELRLIIELDGDSHADQSDYDADRTKWLEGNDHHVFRYFNHWVHDNLIDVLESILRKADDIRLGKLLPLTLTLSPGVPGERE
jgi:very-short-patch-repair endonuclease